MKDQGSHVYNSHPLRVQSGHDAPLKRLREARGLTGEELGRLVGTQKTTISKWELDQRRISVVNARLLARALDCDWPEIFGRPPRPPADVLELSRRVAELPPEDRDRVSQRPRRLPQI